jgi:tripartite-type tricarboxylate transporter receptor subunit TctC
MEAQMAHSSTRIRRRLVLALASAGVSFGSGAIHAGGASAADSRYPVRPVTIVVPFAPGGPADAIVRVIAEQLHARLGQAFVPEFKAGAGGIIGTDYVAKAAPDGYTLLMASSDMLVNNTATYKNLPYDPRRDFVFITHLGTVPMVFAVNAAVPANDLQEFAGWAGARRGKLSYGSWGHGINAHIAAEILLNQKLGAQAAHATYRGLAPLVQDLVGQQITAAFGVVPAFAQFVQAGRLRVLGVTGANRVAAFPEVRTFAEQGYSDEIFRLRMWMAILAPGATPQPIVERLNREIVQIVKGPEIQALLGNAGLELLANSPEEAQRNLRYELDIVPRLIREVGVQGQ